MDVLSETSYAQANASALTKTAKICSSFEQDGSFVVMNAESVTTRNENHLVSRSLANCVKKNKAMSELLALQMQHLQTNPGVEELTLSRQRDCIQRALHHMQNAMREIANISLQCSLMNQSHIL